MGSWRRSGSRLASAALLVDHRAAVADELGGEPAPLRGWEQVGHLVLLRDGQRLRRGARARVVVARERQHDDEAEEHGEAGRQDAEDARRAVAVVEVAPLGGAPADEQHHADGEARRHGHDDQRQEDVHRRLATSSSMVQAPSGVHHSHRMRAGGASPAWDEAARRRRRETRPVGHVHVHPPHALTDSPEPAPPDRTERRLELGAVLLLALTTLATAWCGYQAARWSGEQSQHYARASATRIKSQQAATRAGQLRIDDLLYFNGWLDARQSGNARLAAIYRARFRPEFVPAFRAWVAQRPFTNPRAIPGPLYMPQYRSANLVRSARLDSAADELYQQGTAAKSDDDKYILSTVFFAAVLFFAGISLRLDWRPLRIAVLGMALALLLGGVTFVLTLPVAY